jgi:hypothetical protein
MGRGAAVTMGGASMYETMEPQLATARYERAQVWGIDCVEDLEWRGWEPGGEYVRSLVVKNVSTKTLKVKYKLPATKYFSMEFPEPIKLSPGMSATVDVTFRPIKREQYDDFIEFTVPGGTFDVNICALLPVVSVEVRRHISNSTLSPNPNPNKHTFGFFRAFFFPPPFALCARRGDVAFSLSRWVLAAPVVVVAVCFCFVVFSTRVSHARDVFLFSFFSPSHIRFPRRWTLGTARRRRRCTSTSRSPTAARWAWTSSGR